VGAGDRAGGGHPADDTTFGMRNGQNHGWQNHFLEPQPSEERQFLTTIEHGGRCEKEQPKVGPKGEGMGTTESNDTDLRG
jgi:hypothetical protein